MGTEQGGPYCQGPHNARGAAFGDLDDDGKIDVVISHLNEPVAVLRNVADTAGRHWLGIELVGRDRRDLVGARVVVTAGGVRQTRFVKGGASFACTNDPRLVFGLGSSANVTGVTVHWPTGQVQELSGVHPGGYWRLIEGDPTPIRVAASRP